MKLCVCARAGMLPVIINNSTSPVLRLLDIFWLKQKSIFCFHYSKKLKWWICECCQLLLLVASILKQRESYMFFISIKKPQQYRYEVLMECFLYKIVTICGEKKHFHKNIEFLINSASNCSSCVGLSLSKPVLQQNRLSCNMVCSWKFSSSSRMSPWHFLNLRGCFLC